MPGWSVKGAQLPPRFTVFTVHSQTNHNKEDAMSRAALEALFAPKPVKAVQAKSEFKATKTSVLTKATIGALRLANELMAGGGHHKNAELGTGKDYHSFNRSMAKAW